MPVFMQLHKSPYVLPKGFFTIAATTKLHGVVTN